jgi:hypothetical protein
LYWSAEIPGKVLAKAYLQGISIKPWARRDLDKNSFETKVRILAFIIKSIGGVEDSREKNLQADLMNRSTK